MFGKVIEVRHAEENDKVSVLLKEEFRGQDVILGYTKGKISNVNGLYLIIRVVLVHVLEQRIQQLLHLVVHDHNHNYIQIFVMVPLCNKFF